MSNFYGTSRTSYATIESEAANKFAEKWGLQVITKDGKIGFLPSKMSEDGMFPSYLYSDDDVCEEEFSFAEICEHIAPGEGLIVIGAGADKLRYVAGWAETWSREGLVNQVSLGDVYKLTKEAGLSYTPAEY